MDVNDFAIILVDKYLIELESIEKRFPKKKILQKKFSEIRKFLSTAKEDYHWCIEGRLLEIMTDKKSNLNFLRFLWIEKKEKNSKKEFSIAIDALCYSNLFVNQPEYIVPLETFIKGIFFFKFFFFFIIFFLIFFFLNLKNKQE